LSLQFGVFARLIQASRPSLCPPVRYFSPAVKIKLLCQNALASPREITIDRFPIELGRGVAVGVRIDDRWLSRRHCELSSDGVSAVVRDLRSSHGTFVNGLRLTAAVVLAEGDDLQIGLSHFTVEYQEEGARLHDSAGFDAAVVS
jgi:pSer/pThr/pTyr-binding forkhead associated (FHA) protein